MIKDEWYYMETRRGRFEIWWWDKRYRARQIPETFWRRLAFLLPRPLMLWALVRVAAGTCGDDPPDLLNYPKMFDRWESGQGQ